MQTFGELAHWHPHVHALVTDGAVDSTEKILRHCGLWTDPPPSRAPHAILYTPPVQLDLLYVAEDAEPYDGARYDASG